MKLRRLKPLAALLIIIATIFAFSWYVSEHPDIIDQLAQTNPWLVAGLLLLYVIFMGGLIAVQMATLRLAGLHIPRIDNVLLTIYSTIINFFGPLQSGPGFRGIYLKKKFGLSLRRYTAASLGYYAWFAAWSGLFIATGFSWHWWLLGISMAIVLSAAVWRFGRKKLLEITKGWQIKNVMILGIATLLQLAVVALIYFTELRSIDSGISFHQALIYTGAANFALFVSVTPGAIGFRESFVLFTSQLHHIETPTVIAANLLDRATYILLLGILFLVTLGLHARKRLNAVNQSTHPSDEQ